MIKIKYQINTDYEGELSPNDAAHDATVRILVEKGIVKTKKEAEKVYLIISGFDDVTAEMPPKDAPQIVKDLNYTSGDTLRLIPVFFKALDVTDKELRNIYKEIGQLYPGAEEGAIYIQQKLGNELNIISTSWLDFLVSMNEGIVDEKHIYGTPMELDKYHLEEDEKEIIKNALDDISKLEEIEIGKDVTDYSDLTDDQQFNYKTMEKIFFEDFAAIPEVMKMYNEINPVGSKDKAEAVKKAAKKAKVPLKNTICIGDSSTDKDMLALVWDEGGIPISHNAKYSAVEQGKFNLITENYFITVALVAIANEKGKDGLIEVAQNWNHENLIKYMEKHLDPQVFIPIKERLYEIFKEENIEFPVFTHLRDLDETELELLKKYNEEIRIKLRGKSIAAVR